MMKRMLVLLLLRDCWGARHHTDGDERKQREP
jgi:hypothetical protein